MCGSVGVAQASRLMSEFDCMLAIVGSSIRATRVGFNSNQVRFEFNHPGSVDLFIYILKKKKIEIETF